MKGKQNKTNNNNNNNKNSTKNIVPGKVIIQIWRKESFSDKQKLKKFTTTQPALEKLPCDTAILLLYLSKEN